VDFDDHGSKLFVTSIMTAELIGEAPATPPKTSAAARLPPQQGAKKSCCRNSSQPLLSLCKPVRTSLRQIWLRVRLLAFLTPITVL